MIIIDAGQLIYDGPLSAIKQRFGKFRRITFETAERVSGVQLPEGVEIVEKAERSLVLRFDRTQISASQVAANLMQQIEVADFSLAEPDLSSIVKQIYQGALQHA
ncbi:MAG: DUF4162 domain-containing protein [Anaerolineae bacterium]|nr:DUF4162 domain-containing protein [Anaerolineae bacterium]